MNCGSKKAVITFLIIGILFGVLLPYLSAVALVDDITDIGECALRNRLKQFLSDVISEVARAIKGAIRAAVCAGISFFTGGLVNCPDEVITKGATEQDIAKEAIEDTISRCIARQALTRMTRGILEVVREGGRDGGPAYVQNWRDFTLQSQYRGENIWRGLLYIAANGDPDTNLDPVLCRHIRESQAFQSLRPSPVPNLIRIMPNRRVDSLQEYIVAAKCDPVVDANFETFVQDFSAGGGWDTFERLLQPQNNIFGATEMTLAELEKQRSLEEKIATNEAISGQGFLGVRGDNAPDSCLATDSLGKCIVYKNIKSPGFVIGESAVQAAIKSELDWLVSVDEINELLTDMFFVVTARLKNLGGNDTETPPIEIPDVGGSIDFAQDPVDVCVASCVQSYCTQTGFGDEYDCTTADSGLNSCTSACYGTDGENNGNGNGQTEGPCATQEEIDQFLQDNPGDEGRLAEAFPCP